MAIGSLLFARKQETLLLFSARMSYMLDCMNTRLVETSAYKCHTQLAKISFDEIIHLTIVLFVFNIAMHASA